MSEMGFPPVLVTKAVYVSVLRVLASEVTSVNFRFSFYIWS